MLTIWTNEDQILKGFLYQYTPRKGDPLIPCRSHIKSRWDGLIQQDTKFIDNAMTNITEQQHNLLSRPHTEQLVWWRAFLRKHTEHAHSSSASKNKLSFFCKSTNYSHCIPASGLIFFFAKVHLNTRQHRLNSNSQNCWQWTVLKQ